MSTTTLRNYLTPDNLEKLVGIDVTDNDEALNQLDRAEQAVDDYIGYHCRAVEGEFQGTISSVQGKVIYDTNNASQLHQTDGYFARCVIEIIGGTGAGQVRYISDSSYEGRSVTILDDWTTAPDTTSFYRIYQVGIFPRPQETYTRQDGRRYYKAIPEAVQRAVAAQIEFMIQKGDAFFVGDQADITSESIGNYSYSKTNGGQSAAVSGLAPRARTLLRGYKNRTGRLIADNPTSL